MTPVPRPSVRLELGDAGQRWQIAKGETSVAVEVRLVTIDLDRPRCTLTHDITPDKPWIAPSTRELQPVARQTLEFIDGRHTFEASCPSGNGRLTTRVFGRAADGLPEACRDDVFEHTPITADILAELASRMVGTWFGCVTTPWVPRYAVEMTFRSDGTYRAVSTEVLDDQRMIAMYYGSDADSPEKRYEVLDLQDSLNGVGQIDIWFGPDNVNRGDLRNVKLMSDALEFEFFHRGEYGPLLFQLVRQ